MHTCAYLATVGYVPKFRRVFYHTCSHFQNLDHKKIKFKDSMEYLVPFEKNINEHDSKCGLALMK